jgi:CubicO group peptidase (beta-lactamase class C family)
MKQPSLSVGRILLRLLGVAIVAGVVLTAWKRPDRALNIAMASASETLCSGVFVSHQDEKRVFDESVASQPGLHPLLRGMKTVVDGNTVIVRWHGGFEAKTTYYLGYGCALPLRTPSEATLAAARALPPASAEPPMQPGDATMQAAMATAFAEPAQGPRRNVHAIVVLHRGQIIAERYADGFTPETPQIGYSLSKSVVHALVGILVRQHRLDVTTPAPVAAWRDTTDPRHAITIDQLLRMESGLDFPEADTGFDPVSRMMFATRDMAAYAAAAPLASPPGTRWEYTSGNTLIVSGIIRDTLGGGAPALLAFAHAELFKPLGMEHVLMEFDGAQSLIGSTRVYASARDWARLGQLYLNDGMAGGQRVLPEGWAASAGKRTLGALYGSGFWSNVGPGKESIDGLPSDAYFASGKDGQRVVIVPSDQLVIVRLGSTVDPPNYDIKGLVKLVADVRSACCKNSPTN